MSVVGGRLLVCGSSDGLVDRTITSRYFDVTAATPILHAEHDASPCGVLVTRDRSVAAAFLGRDASSIALYDMTSADAPFALGHAEHRGDAEHVAIVGDALLVSNEHGLVAYPIVCD